MHKRFFTIKNVSTVEVAAIATTLTGVGIGVWRLPSSLKAVLNPLKAESERTVTPANTAIAQYVWHIPHTGMRSDTKFFIHCPSPPRARFPRPTIIT